MGPRLLVYAPLVAALAGCLLRPSGKPNGNTPGDASGTDASGMTDAGLPVDAASSDATPPVDVASTTTACDAGYTALSSCSCSNATENGDGTRTLSGGSSCTCSAMTAFTEAYVNVDGSSAGGSQVTFTIASSGGTQGVKDVIGTDVQFWSGSAKTGDSSTSATMLYLGLTVGTQSVAGFYATGPSPAPMIGGSGWTQAGSANATATFPAMVNIAVSPSNDLPPNNPVIGSVTISSICVK